MNDPKEDEDTEESRSSWLQHQHTKKRAYAQRKEVELLQLALNGAAVHSTDSRIAGLAANLHCATAFLKVLEGREQ